MVDVSKNQKERAGEKAGAVQKSEWHLDKRVPVTLILVLTAQAVSVVWMFATMSAQLDQHERRLARLPATFPPVSWTIKMTRLESEIGHLRRSVDSLNRNIRRYGSRGIIPGGKRK